MIHLPFPEQEDARLGAIGRYRMEGLGRGRAFDHVAELGGALFDVPISLVSIVTQDMQCFRGATGIQAPATPRDIAFCAFAILDDGVMVVEDAMEDERLDRAPATAAEGS